MSLSFRQEKQERTLRMKKHPKPFTDTEIVESIRCDGPRVVSPQILQPSDYLYGDGRCANAFTEADACAALTCIRKEIPAPYSYVLRKSTLTVPLNPSSKGYGTWAITPVSFAHDQVGMSIFDGSFVVGRQECIRPDRRQSIDFQIPYWAHRPGGIAFDLDQQNTGRLVAVLYEKESNLIFFSIVCEYTGAERHVYVDQVVNYSTRKHRGLCAPFFDHLFNYIFYHPKWICNTVSLQCVINFANQGRSFSCYMRAIGTYFPVFGIRDYTAGRTKPQLGLAVQTKNRTLDQLAESVHKMFTSSDAPSPLLRMNSQLAMIWHRVYDDNSIIRNQFSPANTPAYTWEPQTKSTQASGTLPRTPSALQPSRAKVRPDLLRALRDTFQFPLMREKVRALKARLRDEPHPVKRYTLKMDMHEEFSAILRTVRTTYPEAYQAWLHKTADEKDLFWTSPLYQLQISPDLQEMFDSGVRYYEEEWDKIKRL